MNKKIKEMRKYWWVLVGGVLILVLVGVLIAEIGEGVSEGEESEEQEVSFTEVVETEDGVQFTNSEFVEKFVGERGAEEAVRMIEEGVYGFLEEGAYTGFMAGSDVEKGVSFPFDTLEFILQVSNGENFEVAMALMKDAYVGILVRPVEGEKASLYMEFLRPAEEAGYEEGEAKVEILEWAKGVMPGVEIKETEGEREF